MNRVRKKYRSGAASFYIVAFSTLILVVIAMSFTAIIISEMTRTANDDLAQSAYDSALAGVEDAKVAYYNYQSCVEQGVKANDAGISLGSLTPTCQDIVNWVERPNMNDNMKECDMVGHIVGRIGKQESSEVMIQEKQGSDGENNMQQAYTCAKISTELKEYKMTLSSGNNTRVVQIKLADNAAQSVKYIKVSWGAKNESENVFSLYSNGDIEFPTLKTKAATPPMLAVGIVQTTDIFNLTDFDMVSENATDRGTVYLVPIDESNDGDKLPDNHKFAWDSDKGANVISAAEIVKSNDRTVKNLPFSVYCDESSGDEFTCSALLQLPQPYDSANLNSPRSSDTFMAVIGNPYGAVDTNVMLQFCGDNGCENAVIEGGGASDDVKTLRDMQISIDSTGRANDLYRRIEARIDTSDVHFPYPLYGVELLGDDKDGSLLEKALVVTSEYNF